MDDFHQQYKVHPQSSIIVTVDDASSNSAYVFIDEHGPYRITALLAPFVEALFSLIIDTASVWVIHFFVGQFMMVSFAIVDTTLSSLFTFHNTIMSRFETAKIHSSCYYSSPSGVYVIFGHCSTFRKPMIPIFSAERPLFIVIGKSSFWCTLIIHCTWRFPCTHTPLNLRIILHHIDCAMLIFGSTAFVKIWIQKLFGNLYLF